MKIVYTNTYRIANARIGDKWWAMDRLVLAETLGYTVTPHAAPKR